MLPRIALASLAALWALSAHAQDVTNPAPPISVNGAYNASVPTCVDGHGCWFQTDVNGNLKVVTSGTPSGVQAVSLPTTPLIASGNGVIAAPTAVATGATTRASSTAAASNLVLKGSAGNLYDLQVTIGATSGYLLLFDATALPSNGAVTPVFCGRVNSDGTAGGASFAWPMPFPFATGITAGFSTTGCFTLTASATGNFFGGYK